MRVLIVEDDFILLLDLEAILQKAGADIIGLCRSLDEALPLVEQAEMSVAILDVRIGQNSIAPVARQLTARNIPFLFYTGQIATDPLLSEWSDCRVIEKPAAAPTIVATIHEVLREHEANSAASQTR
ncbi:MAG: response regulator [Xanthobacteraceae bacterium]